MFREGHVTEFSVSGHAGLAEAPHDILCAAVSSMSMLVINTCQDVFGAVMQIEQNEEKPLLSVRLVSVSPENASSVDGVLTGFYRQLSELIKEYPRNLTVKSKHSERK